MEITAKIITILERCKKEIQAAMAAGGVNASGRTSASLKVEPYAGGVRLVSGGEKIAPFETLETGRKAGKVPFGFTAILVQWSRDKGIGFSTESKRRSFAYLLGRKIAREGTVRHRQPRNDIYTPAVTAAVAEIRETIGAEIREQIKTN